MTAPLKPTLYSGDAGKLPVSIAGLPPTALTGGGRWKQRSSKEATHLPFRAGYNWIRTASAGIRFCPKALCSGKALIEREGGSLPPSLFPCCSVVQLLFMVFDSLKRFAPAKRFSFSAYSAKLCLHMACLFGIIRIELPEGMTSRFFRAKTQTYERNDPK